MKKYIGFLLVIISPPIFAYSYTLCTHLLEINIKNDTKTLCHLIYKNIRLGSLYFQEIPLETMTIIPAGMQGSLQLLTSPLFYNQEIVLSYQCGDDKFVTFVSIRSALSVLSAWVTSIADMNAKYRMEGGYCSLLSPTEGQRPASINWTLY